MVKDFLKEHQTNEIKLMMQEDSLSRRIREYEKFEEEEKLRLQELEVQRLREQEEQERQRALREAELAAEAERIRREDPFFGLTEEDIARENELLKMRREDERSKVGLPPRLLSARMSSKG